MKLCSYISRLQELNTFLEKFPPNAPGQETALLSTDENLGYHLSFHVYHMKKQDDRTRIGLLIFYHQRYD